MPSNADVLRTAFDAWNRDDCDAWLELLDPDIEISTAGVFPDLAAEYHGRDLAAKFWRQLREPWETFRILAEEIEEDGDVVFASVRFQGTGVDSGVEVDMPFGNAILMRDGVATNIVNRRTAEEAREALRLREGDATGSSVG